MKAARWYGHKDIRVEEIPMPLPCDDEVRIRVKWAGICGTDRHEYVGPNFIPVTKPHRLTGKTAPLTMGHEFAGVIDAVGADAPGWQIGDRVTATGTLSCGRCPFCLSGRENICEKLGFVGVGDDGTFADYAIIRAKNLFRIPDEISFRHAVLCEPLACGQHAVNLIGGNLAGQNVVVTGSGIIGISCAIAAKLAGAKNVILSGVGEEKRNVAEKIGLRYHNVRQGSLVEACSNLTEGRMADLVFECVGVQATLDDAIRVMRPGAALMVMGVFEKAPVFPMNDFQEGERRMFSSQAHLHEIGECLDKMKEGLYPWIEELITGECELAHIVEDGFEAMNRNPEQHIKMLIRVAEEGE